MKKRNLELTRNMPSQEHERIPRKVRALIKKECGAKGYPSDIEKPVPPPEEAMAMTGTSEDELARRFIEYLIEQGKNPF